MALSPDNVKTIANRTKELLREPISRSLKCWRWFIKRTFNKGLLIKIARKSAVSQTMNADEIDKASHSRVLADRSPHNTHSCAGSSWPSSSSL